MEELSEIKKTNCVETLVFCDGVPHQESAQLPSKDKLFHSINNLPIQSSAYSPLATSGRSNAPASKFTHPPFSPPEGLTNSVHPATFKQSYRNFPTIHSPPVNQINLYSSIPTQSLIQQNYAPMPQPQPKSPPILVSSNEYSGFPRPGAHNHQNSMAFTSAIFPSGGRIAMGSPLGAKKASYQVFPNTHSNKN